MSEKEKIELLEETLDLEKGEVTSDTLLSEMDLWDSLGKLSLTVMLEEEFGRIISGDDINALVSIKDILNLMEKQ